MWKINLSKLICTEISYHSHMARKLVEADADPTQSYSDKTIKQTVTLLTVPLVCSPKTPNWSSCGQLITAYSMELRTSSMHCNPAQHHIIPRQTQTTSQDKHKYWNGTSSMHCNRIQHNITTEQRSKTETGRGTVASLACLPNTTTPAAFRQRQVTLHSLFAFSVSVSVYLCLPLYLSIDISLYCHTIISIATLFIHLIITISLTRSLTKSF